MEEEWRPVEAFPRYSVSDLGRVRNEDTDRILRVSQNRNGILYVPLRSDKRQYNRSIAKLVLEAFVPRPNQYFDTPIYLNNQQLNCSLRNLMWRPRWFAMKYTMQFNQNLRRYPAIRDKWTEEVFPTIWHVVPVRGLLYMDVAISTQQHVGVFPTKDLFEWVR